MKIQVTKAIMPGKNTEIVMLLGGLFKRVSTEYKRKYYFCGIQVWSAQVSPLKVIRSEIDKLHYSETISKIEKLIKQTTEQFSSEIQKNSKSDTQSTWVPFKVGRKKVTFIIIIFVLYPWHVEVPRPGTEPISQQ